MVGGAASCEVADTGTSMTLPVSTLPVSVAAVPAVGTPSPPARHRRSASPDAVLFAADSPALRPGADNVLARLANQLSTCPTGAQIHIIGHTADVDHHHVDGQDLSDQRAFVCRDRQVAHGVPVFTEVRGVADTQPRVADVIDEQTPAPLPPAPLPKMSRSSASKSDPDKPPKYRPRPASPPW